MHLDNLFPQIGQHREGQITVGNGGLEGAFNGGLLGIHVNPLVVECGIGKEVDALLVEFYIVAFAESFAQHGGKLLIVVDDQFLHFLLMLI